MLERLCIIFILDIFFALFSSPSLLLHVFLPWLVFILLLPSKCPDPRNCPCSDFKGLKFYPVTYLFWFRRCEFSYYVRLTRITPQSRWCSHFLEFSEIGFLLTEVVKTSLDEIQVTPCALHSIYFAHLLHLSLYVIGLFKSWSTYCSYLNDVARSSLATFQRFWLQVGEVQ
jgi:hypothetical protein